jgi:phosphatidyl-myo-inositol dimannoside synthase
VQVNPNGKGLASSASPRRIEREVLGLFPLPDPSSFGGVQVSGLEAWDAVKASVGDARAHALYYQAGTSKLRALLGAVGQGRRTDVLLVWHLHLMKLMPVLKLPKARVAVFLHGIEAWRPQGTLMDLLLDNVDVFLPNTEFTWNQFRKHNPHLRSPVHKTIHLGMGLPLRTASPKAAQAPAVLMIGRLDRGEDYKGHRQMIAAWRLVVERVPGATLWIIGDGNLRPDLEALARQSAPAASVQFFGKVPNPTKEQLLADCRCVAMPSRGEGFGLVYLEAMRVGRPCLVSDADAGREVVNPPEAGIAVDPDKPEGLVNAVQRMLTPGPEWDRWSIQARARYEAHFTSAHFHRRLLTALLEY